MKLFPAAGILTAAALLLSGCSAGGSQSGPPPFAPAEEDRLVVYTSHKEEVWQPIVREFESRTGIWVDAVSYTHLNSYKQIGQERRSSP